MSLTVVTAVLTLAAVYFTVKALLIEGGYESAAKFSGSHQTMGLLLLIGVWIQVLGGILRPKMKHKDHVKMPLGASDEENRRTMNTLTLGMTLVLPTVHLLSHLV